MTSLDTGDHDEKEGETRETPLETFVDGNDLRSVLQPLKKLGIKNVNDFLVYQSDDLNLLMAELRSNGVEFNATIKLKRMIQQFIFENQTQSYNDMQFNTDELSSIEKLETQLKALESMIVSAQRINSGEPLKADLDTLHSTADILHKAIDSRTTQLEAEIQRKHAQIAEENIAYCTQLETISAVLKETYESCRKGLNMSNPTSARSTMMVEGSKAAIALAQKSADAMRSKMPPKVSLNMSESKNITSVIAAFGSVEIDDDCELHVTDFSYSVRAAMATMGVKWIHDQNPDVVTLKSEECQSIRLETIAIVDDTDIIEEKQCETSQLIELTPEQLQRLNLDVKEWTISGVATRQSNGSFEASDIDLTEKSRFGIRFTPFNAAQQSLIPLLHRSAYYFTTDDKTPPPFRMEIGTTSQLKLRSVDNSIEINNPSANGHWYSARSVARFNRSAAFHSRVVNSGSNSHILIGAFSESVDWETIAAEGGYAGNKPNSIGYFGYDGHPCCNSTDTDKSINWGKYGSNDTIECLVDYESGDVSFFHNSTKVGTYVNALAASEPYYFAVCLGQQNQSVIARESSVEELNRLLLQ